MVTPLPGPALDRLAELAVALMDVEGCRITYGPSVGAAGSRAVPASVCAAAFDRGEPISHPDASELGLAGALLAVPLAGAGGAVVGCLCVVSPTGRAWTELDVAVLQRLGALAAAELTAAEVGRDLALDQVRWGLAIDAAGIGGFDWDLTTGVLTWDDRLIELYGYEREGFEATIETFYARLHRDDLDRVTAQVQTLLATGDQLDLEYRVVRPDGTERWVAARGSCVLDPATGAVVRMLGAAYDTTSDREGEARVARVLEAMSAAFYALDRSWRFTYVNAEAERLLGRPREELLGGDIWELFPSAVGSVFETSYRASLASGEPTTFEAYYPAPLDRWYELRVWPGPDGLSVYFLDITERRAAQRAGEQAGRRAALLTQVSEELAGTLDIEQAVARLARVLVPTVADWCIVSLLSEDGSVQDVRHWHHDPDRRADVARYSLARTADPSVQEVLRRVVSTGRAHVVGASAGERDPAMLAVAADSDEGADLVARLATEATAVLPLTARGRVLGLLTVARAAVGDSALLAEDLAVTREVATRAALALDNLRLFQEQRDLAEGLQRSLLTPPPEPDHAQVVVRYAPASQAAQVGGDWYDAFLQPDGATVVVIGDVVGHDVEAAAAMGQLRGLLRGIAYTTGEGPASVLTRLDEAVEGLLVRTTATAVVLRIEQSEDEMARGITRLRWSNAGHPPPMVVHSDGEVQVLAALEADLLLGLDPGTPRAESVTVVDRGATVLLYTDGLIERRGQGLDEGLALLRATLAELADLPLDEMCDRVIEQMLPPAAEDDVALVAVRLHRQDRPRPAEAGPQVVPPGVDPEPVIPG